MEISCSFCSLACVHLLAATQRAVSEKSPLATICELIFSSGLCTKYYRINWESIQISQNNATKHGLRSISFVSERAHSHTATSSLFAAGAAAAAAAFGPATI